MGVENDKDVWVLVFNLEGREQIFKAYANANAKTGRRAKKHARLKTEQYGTRFTAKVMTLEGEQNDGKERTTNNTETEEGTADTSQGNDNGPDDRGGTAGLPGDVRGGSVGGSEDRDIFERLQPPTFTEENYKAGLFDEAARPILETVEAEFGNAERDELARQLGVIIDEDPITFTESQFKEFQERGGLGDRPSIVSIQGQDNRDDRDRRSVFIREDGLSDTGGETDEGPESV